MEDSIDTICVQSGWKPHGGEPRVLPIYQSTTFKYDSSEHMGRLFALEESGYFYTRLQNPTCDAVAAKICELEGGAAAMLTSSASRTHRQLSEAQLAEAGVPVDLIRLSVGIEGVDDIIGDIAQALKEVGK